MWCIAPEWPEHARHIAVEFVHPVLVGKRALPAVSVESADPVAALRSLVRSGDVVLAVSTGESATTREIMRRAEAWGATTIWMGVGPRPAEHAADHIVWIDEDVGHVASPAVHDGRLVLLYHVLWELTHVCFEHPGLLTASSESARPDADVCITCSDEGRVGEVISAGAGIRSASSHRQRNRVDRHHHRCVRSARGPGSDSRWHRDLGDPVSEATNFLYPFIDSDERDAEALLLDLAQSARAKQQVSATLRQASLEQSAEVIERASAAMSTRFARGGRLFVFGNGGSSTDASSLASLFVRPPWGVPLPARNLVDDSAVLTALGNDVGFDLVFSRQLIAHANESDIAIGLSTSGNSRNLLHAFDEAANLGLLAIGIAGYSGGEMAASADVHHCLVVDADSVHRIQETQAALGFALWRGVQSLMSTMEAAS